MVVKAWNSVYVCQREKRDSKNNSDYKNLIGISKCPEWEAAWKTKRTTHDLVMLDYKA